ncbi:hypothetical protein [Pseudophaeobacter sp.]|uniref:hypothetical protein n=1 Tax=Pseudophaeobacter sp. TaxID=1971739 RepID=UPI0025E4B306|nr:hypothetical protein [uncultured Pseudophaeobacter sp.]
MPRSLPRKKWPDNLDQETRVKAAQSAQLSVFFVQGIDPCEVLVAEGLYGQAASLIRQHMEIIGAIDEIWAGKRRSNQTPKISSLPHRLRQHHGGLSELSQAAVPKYLENIHTSKSGELVGASTEPGFKTEIALFLYRLELGLILLFATKQDEILQRIYGKGLDADEVRFLATAVNVADKMAKTVDEQTKG